MSAPPWKLWGNNSTIRVDQAAPKGTADKSPQLVQVDYKRPDTWRFLAFAKISDSNTAEQTDLIVTFSISIGVGMSMVTLPAVFFRFSRAGGLLVGDTKFATEFRGPDRDDTEAAGDANIIDLLPTQILVVQADVNFQNAVGGRFAVVDVGFFVAPNAHVRPEWHEGVYPGDEATLLVP